ncbi:hypothetical protein [Intestinimonas massiliensis (ex Afouda et al. 2020)]|uniref:Uncharacterized protein n=1 Tax=Intestinimonas massiliensis (ex Afouda et al. 2020) TaxID=1673721 RepID=A0ABS9MEZ6_9FIRM|nr:hypothetical protein [Intestinimonas massiliensis (ex Afouda et al. 2020)]MCG4528869.1 hypothetical protein [Intestinimonas massiliensis (ex Afouda et al. 2020)]
MKVYILIRKMDDFESSAVATPHLSLEAAQAAMADDFKDILEVFGLSPNDEQEEEKQWSIEEKSAHIRYDICSRYADWSIQEHDLPVQLAIRVRDGMVQEAIANADISVDVFDLDSQDLAEDGKTFEADRLDADYQKLGKEPGWRAVY